MPRFALLLAVLAAALLPAPALADTGSPNLDLVKTVPYELKHGETSSYGTDVEFASLRGKQYALAGSYTNGLQIVDVTAPADARVAAVYDCAILQGDVQVFKAADGTKRTLATYTADSAASAAKAQSSACFREAEALGFDAVAPDGRGRQGTFIVDITDPRRPRTVSFVEVPQGSHNQTVHPSGGWLYNSNSELIADVATRRPEIEIVDIRDPDNPVRLPEGLKLATLPGLGTDSHDITFSADGTRAYSAALSHGAIIDTTDPGRPRLLTTFDDEAINVWHQMDPVSVGGRDYLVAEDEFAGAAGGGTCPSGGVHVYDVTGERENAPVKVGYWNIEDIGPTQDPTASCTAHVFDLHESAGLMTIAFYDGGVRVVDLNGLATGDGLKEIAKFRTSTANTWSFKAPSVSRDGVFHAYGNDIDRGLDVYRYDGAAQRSGTPGTWIPGATTAAKLEDAGLTATTDGTTTDTTTTSLSGYRMACLLK